MQLPTQSNQFLFSLPVDFISDKIEKRWMPLLKKNRLYYSSVLDFLNSTIRSITFPSMSFDSSKQNIKRKIVYWKPVVNIYDTITRDTDITFQAVDSNINHLIILDAITDSYLNTKKNYVEPLTMYILDKYRDIIAHVHFRSVNIRSLSEIFYSFSDISLEDKTFTMQITYNYLDVVMMFEDIIKEEDVRPGPAKNPLN